MRTFLSFLCAALLGSFATGCCSSRTAQACPGKSVVMAEPGWTVVAPGENL